jgi:microcystin-dependent protein
MNRTAGLKFATIFIIVVISTSANVALAQLDDKFVGEIEYVPSDLCPQGDAPADGRMLTISQNRALFALLGTRYGGDGRTNFGLPKLENLPTKTGAVVKACIVTEGVFPPR